MPDDPNPLIAGTPNGTPVNVVSGTGSTDMRVRLKAQTGQEDRVYGAGIASVLKETGGLLFPYTPTITVSQDVAYQDLALTHSNGDILAYTRTPSVTLSVTGKFTVQNRREGRYALAALHFLRGASKMHFGQTDVYAGLPPPLLILEGYGTYMFHGIKVAVRRHNYTLDDSHDMVDVEIDGRKSARIPSLFQLQVELTVQNTPNESRTQFNLAKFRDGSLMTDKGGWL